MHLLLPDPLIDPRTLTGAVWLYFDGPFIATCAPGIATPESFELFRLVEERQPEWAPRLQSVAGCLAETARRSNRAWKLITRIDSDSFKLVYVSFAANAAAYEQVDNWVAGAGYEYADLVKAVIPEIGFAELARHVFLERYVELDRDLKELYSYCDTIFSLDSPVALVVSSYLLRLQVLMAVPSDARILLTNENLAPLFEKLSNEREPSSTRSANVICSNAVVDKDVVAWEFFRVLVSPLVDPLDEDGIGRLAEVRRKSRDLIVRLRERCADLAADAEQYESVVDLSSEVSGLVDRKLRTELRELFELDQRAWSDFLTNISTDKVAWGALVSLLSGVTATGPVLTAAGAVAGLVSLGTNAMKARGAREQKLRDSDLALLRVLKRGAD